MEVVHLSPLLRLLPLLVLVQLVLLLHPSSLVVAGGEARCGAASPTTAWSAPPPSDSRLATRSTGTAATTRQLDNYISACGATANSDGTAMAVSPLGPWGGGSAPKCYANRIQGYASVSSFRYHLIRSVDDTTALDVAGAIISGHGLVDSVNISSLMPQSGSATWVKATFANPVVLNASEAYYAAFCVVGGTSSRQYNVYTDQNIASMVFCSNPNTLQACSDSLSPWGDFNYVLGTTIEGECPSPSPSPSPSSTPSPSTSPSSTPSPSPSPSPTPSRSPTPSPAFFQSGFSEIAAAPVLRFNYKAPEVAILPKDAEDEIKTKAAVGVALAAMTEVASSVDASPLASAYCVNGSWQATDSSMITPGASQSFTYSCLLDIIASNDSNGGNGTTADTTNVTMEMQFDLFESLINFSLNDLVNLTITPSLTKFSLRVRGRWPWHSADSRLELRMSIDPTFTRALLINTVTGATTNANGSRRAVARATTWRLEGQKPANGSSQSMETLVRLVNVVEMDGEARVGDQWIVHTLVPAKRSSPSSGLVVSFGQFNESMSYDPDVGVLLGRTDSKGDGSVISDDNLGVVIALAVAVAVAIAVIVLVVLGSIGLLWYQREAISREYRARGKSVNFHSYDVL